MKILLVDDDRDLVDLLEFVLRRAGMDPLTAHDARSALQLFDREQPNLVVLDVGLGRDDGIEVLQELRRRGRTPVILLTGRDSEDDKVRGLELGADDYLTKPFSHRELVARIRARLRPGDLPLPTQPLHGELVVGPLRLNPAEHTLTIDDQPIKASVTEFRLLHYLMLNAGSVVPTAVLMRHVWGYEDPGGGDVVRVTLHRLRRKLGDDPARPRLLRTVPGVGVLLKPEPDPDTAV